MKTPTNTKNLILKLVLLCAALLWGITAQAQVRALTAWTTSTVATNSYGGSYNYAAGGTNFCVASINSAAGQQAVATYINVKCDAAANNLELYSDPQIGTTNNGTTCVSNSTTTIQLATRYDSTGTNVVASNTNGFFLSAPVVIRHLANDNYEIRIISTITATNITVDAAPATAIANGDQIFPYIKAGSITVGAATVTIGPGGIITASQPGVPLLLGADYTTAARIVASGTYQ